MVSKPDILGQGQNIYILIAMLMASFVIIINYVSRCEKFPRKNPVG